ncbi:MAG: HAD family phosphatase [Gemmatimonadota bacterium]|nr:HAD family phosphatase [Gemmatimonadota bacterium]
MLGNPARLLEVAWRAQMVGGDLNRPTFRPEAFLLDLDGVLIDSHAAHIAAYREAFRSYDLVFPLDAEDLVRSGMARAEVLAASGAPPDRLDALSRAKASALEQALERGSLRPGESERRFLRVLRDHGMPCALVSNSLMATTWVQATELDWAFGAVVDGGSAPSLKPSPAGYLLAAELLGAPATSSVVVEDAPIGVKAGRDSGAFVIGIGDRVGDGSVDLRVDSVSSIPVAEWLTEGVRTDPGE